MPLERRQLKYASVDEIIADVEQLRQGDVRPRAATGRSRRRAGTSTQTTQFIMRPGPNAAEHARADRGAAADAQGAERGHAAGHPRAGRRRAAAGRTGRRGRRLRRDDARSSRRSPARSHRTACSATSATTNPAARRYPRGPPPVSLRAQGPLGHDVLEDPHSQPRRDRPPHHPRVPRDGHPDGRRLLHRRPRRRVPEERRPGDLHRRGPAGGELPQDRPDHLRRRDQRRRGDSPRVRVPGGERAVRGDLPRVQDRVHRPAGEGDARAGRQGRGEEDRQARRRCRPCPAATARSRTRSRR